ncbi:MAG: YciI family protein [Ferruginibacter sp.]
MQRTRFLLFAIIPCFFIAGNVEAQVSSRPKAKTAAKPAAKSPEAGIRQYWFVMLKKGNNRTQDSVTAAKIQEGHMANITSLYNAGKLKVAGPFGDDGDWRGIFIFDCETKEEVEKLLATDPAIHAGRLAYEIHPWWTAPSGSFKPGIPKKLN